MSVPDVAEHLGVSQQRVRQMIDAKQLSAERISGRWLIDAASVPAASRRSGQPYSSRIAWAMAEFVDGHRPSGIGLSEMSRLRSRWSNIGGDIDVICSAMSRRAERLRFTAPDPAGLLEDACLIRSGKSDPRSGMAAPGFAEGYVRRDDADDLIADHMLVAARGAENVILHISTVPPPSPVPALIVVSDLADGGPRERQQAEIILGRLMSDG